MARKTTTTTAPAVTVTEAQATAVTDTFEEAKRGTWADAIKAIKAGMASDARKLKTLDNARAALLDVRVTVVRDTAHAMTFAESHAKAGKTAGKPSQSVIAEALGINRLTFAPYFKAAEELHAKFPQLVTEPGIAITDEEREHVASFWKAEALRAKARRDAAAKKADAPKSGDVTTTEGGDDTTGAGAGSKATDGRTSEVTADTAIACMKLLADALEAMAKQELGFTAEQADLMLEALVEAGVAVEELKVAAK